MKQKIHRDGFQMMGQSQPAEDMIQTVWITPDKMRSDNEKQSVIMRLDKGIIFFVDHAQKTYSEMPMDMGQMMGSRMKEEMGEEVSEEDMEGFMAMAKGMMKMKITVTPTGEKKRINKWNCQKYIQKLETMMGPTISEIWATEDLKMDYELYAKFSAGLMGMQPGFKEFLNDMLEEMKKIKGVPVLTTTTVNMMGASMKSLQELLEFKEETAPAGIFDLPKGYKKTEGMNFKQ